MPEATPPAMLPGTYVMDQATVDRLVTTAAMAAAKAMQEQSVKRGEVEEIADAAADSAINRLLERVFDVAPGDAKALVEIRKDFTAMRAAREMREAVVKHGIMAVIGLLVTAIGAAIWYAIKGAK